MTYANPRAYEEFMGRWSARLAPLFLNFVGVECAGRILDVGCGTGVLTRAALATGNGVRVSGIDPVEDFVQFAQQATGDARADFQVASVESLPFPAATFDATLGLLILQEFDDPERSIREMARVTRPSGKVAGCQWDFRGGGMRMTTMFWDVATPLAPEAVARYRAGAGALRDADLGELGRRWAKAGLSDVRTAHLDLAFPFRSFEDFWRPFVSSATPLTTFAAEVNRTTGGALETMMRKKLLDARPDGPFELGARALAVCGTVAG